MTATSWLEYQWAFTTAAWALGAGAAWVLWIALFKDRSRGRKRCPRCWYDMTGVPSLRCPECAYETIYEGRFYSTRRRWKLGGAGAVILAFGIVTHHTPRALDHGIVQGIPLPVLNFVLGLWEDRAEALYATHIKATSLDNLTGRQLAALSTFERLLIASRIQPTNPRDPRSVPEAFEPRASEWEVRRLALLGSELRPALPVLLAYARDTSPHVREASIRLIGACAVGGSHDAGQALKHISLTGQRDEARALAIQTLSTGVYSAPHLRSVLVDVVRSFPDTPFAATGAFALAASAVNTTTDIQEVQALLQSPHSLIRLLCLQGLAKCIVPLPGLRPLCCELLVSDPNPAVRTAAAQAIAVLFDGDAQWAEALHRGMHDSNADVRKECVATLTGLLPRSVLANEVARDALLSDAPAQNRALLLMPVIAAYKDERTALLRTLVESDPAPIVRTLALRALFEHRQEADVESAFFARLLSDPAPEVALAAANCLGRLGKEARPHLDALRQVREHPNAPVRAAIESAIVRIERDPE